MAKEVIEGEIESLIVEIDEELDDLNLDDETEELQEKLEKIEKLRREYIAKTVTLSKLDNNYDIGNTTEKKTNLAKAIKDLKAKKKERLKNDKEAEKSKEDAEKTKADTEAKEKEEKEKRDLKVRKANLLAKYSIIQAMMQELYDTVIERKTDDDVEIVRKKEELKGINEKFTTVEVQITGIVDGLTSDLFFDTEVSEGAKTIMNDLEKLRGVKKRYEEYVKEEIVKRDLSELKQEASTEIKLEKFGGEETGQDFYLFKTTFSKKYRNVKKGQIPDLLKSYLTGAALESAKQLDNETDIWERLKNDFGDVNLMLKRKMEKISQLIAAFCGKRASRDLKDILVDITNKLKDVMELVKEHEIEAKLYSKYEVSDLVAKFPTWFTNGWYALFVKIHTKPDAELWAELLSYLCTQTEIQRVKAESEGSASKNASKGGKEEKGAGRSSFHTDPGEPGPGECPLGCGRTHEEGKELHECSKFLLAKGSKPSDL